MTNQVLRSRYPRPDLQSSSSSVHIDWKSWPALRLRITNLPPKSTTWDIFDNFCHYGTLVRIAIFETRAGDRARVAEISYEPVPQAAFWNHGIPFRTANIERIVAVSIARYQKKNSTIPSPVDRSIRYDEKLDVYGHALDFGFLHEPTAMTAIKKCPAIDGVNPRVVLNLVKGEMEVYFQVLHTSPNRTKPRNFRFLVALDDAFTMWQLPDHSFVIHLQKQPLYSKQLSENIASSHGKDARVWSIEDTWARQTDIVEYTPDMKSISGTPVALQKNLNSINIARWTTFRFRVLANGEHTSKSKIFTNALKDWNVKIHKTSTFQLRDGNAQLETKAWDLINATMATGMGFELQHEMSQIRLPFSVRYQLEVCLSHGWLSEFSITNAFLESLASWPEKKARQALVYVATNQQRLFDPMVLFADIQYSKPIRARKLPEDCVELHSATVTATSIVFHTPSVEPSNRIIRKHKSRAHRFLRVRFEDDAYRGQSRLFTSTGNKMITVFGRVQRALTHGIKLGDIHYQFLAWGNSQLREHGVYFVAPLHDMTADSIRNEMGTFKETVVAKKAARMGQCFSTTRPVQLPLLEKIEEHSLIPDIKRNGYTFTDGVGQISKLAAQLVSNKLKIEGPTPSLFQFRLGGCKGVLAVSDDVPGIGIRIRESQFKFSSLHGELEIIRTSQFWQPFLNRQIILCLNHLGVSTSTFLQMQQQEIKELGKAMHSDSAAVQALRKRVDPNMMTLSMSELVEAGFRAEKEPFVVSLLHLWRAWSLKYLKEKAKISVEHGAFVLGSVDETASLRGHTESCPTGAYKDIVQDPNYLEKLPQIFLQITTNHKTHERRVIEGLCILARNPSLHQGDIRVVCAVDVKQLHHMRDVVVMPQTGVRDLPSMCSGGDLDGDDYIVIWDERLIPPIWNLQPFHYKPEPPKTVAGEITTSHLIDFFYDYLRFDALGKIAHAHLGAADALNDGIENDICQELLTLHSNAVDYPKTGVPAKMERRLERDQWPHFMEKKGKAYHSYKVLGQLYDAVEKVRFTPSYDLPFDPRICTSCSPSDKLLGEVQSVKSEYDQALRRILTQHSIRTEFELWSTFVLDHSKKSRDYKFHEEVGELSRVLKEQYREMLCELAGGHDFEHLAPVAVAAYQVTQDQAEEARQRASEEAAVLADDSYERAGGLDRQSNMPFISFPWLLQDTLIKIAMNAGRDKSRFGAYSVVDGNVVQQQSAMATLPGDKAAGDLVDIANLDLRSTNLSQYLPDPLQTVLETNADQGCTDLESPIPDTTFTDRSTSDTPVSEIDTHQPEEGSREKGQTDMAALESGTMDTENNYGISPDQPQNEITAAGMKQDFHPMKDSMKSSDNRHESTKLQTCFYWKHNGYCRFEAGDCKFTHYDTGIESRLKEQITCWFWITEGQCTHDDNDCRYSHHDTGFTIPPPAYAGDNITIPTSFASSYQPARSSKRSRRRSPTRRRTWYDSDSEGESSPTGMGSWLSQPRSDIRQACDRSNMQEQGVLAELQTEGIEAENRDQPQQRLSLRSRDDARRVSQPRVSRATRLVVEDLLLPDDPMPHSDAKDEQVAFPVQGKGNGDIGVVQKNSTISREESDNSDYDQVPTTACSLATRERTPATQPKDSADMLGDLLHDECNDQKDDHVAGERTTFNDPFYHAEDFEIDELSD